MKKVNGVDRIKKLHQFKNRRRSLSVVLAFFVILATVGSLIVPATAIAKQESEQSAEAVLNGNGDAVNAGSAEAASSDDVLATSAAQTDMPAGPQTLVQEETPANTLPEESDIIPAETPEAVPSETSESTPTETSENAPSGIPSEDPAAEPETGSENVPSDAPGTEPSAQPVIEPAAYPAQSFSGTAGEVTVAVEADAGAFPAKTTMTVQPVADQATIDQIAGAVDGNVSAVRAVDITFFDENGQPVEPLIPIRVNMVVPEDEVVKAASKSAVKTAESEAVVVHLDNSGATQIVDHENTTPEAVSAAAGNMAVNPQDNAVAFEADAFSVYAVVYTVDFHYAVNGKTYDYAITGGAGIGLKELLTALNVIDSKEIDAFVEEIETVVFSDPALIEVTRVEEDTTVGELIEKLGLEVEYSAGLRPETIEHMNAKAFTALDWALLTLKAFDTKETLTITMRDGATFVINVTDDQTNDPLGLNNESFVITNGAYNRSLKAQRDSNAGSLQAQNPPSSDAINVWKFEYDENAFDGAGGYYLVCVINNNNNYLRVNGNNLELASVKPSEAEEGQAAATPFNITFDHEQMRYRISGAADGNSAYLTYVAGGWGQNGSFSLSNTKSDNNLLALRDKNQPSSTPGTVGTWDIKSDGIVMKLFDYQGTVSYYSNSQGRWVNNGNIDKAWGSEVTNQQLRDGQGINHDRSLLFSGSGLGNDEAFNNFTGDKTGGTYYSGYAYQNIVNYNLGADRFPVLQGGNIKTNTDRASSGSLAYLFNDNNISNAKTAYLGENNSGLQGLLRKDAEGYYYYDSEENFAKLVGNEVILYSDTYRKNNSSSTDVKTSKIGLFPFDNYQSNQGEEKGPSGSVYDHQFGMTIGTEFVYPKNGIVPDTQKPMTFEFSGDDDVWVFVDGVLVLDLGGVHQPISGKIDFATGNVTITEFGSNGVEYTSSKSTTIDAMFAKASQEAGRTITFDRTEYSTHKLEFFYLERGGCDSNCKIKFNLLMMKTLTFAKKLNGLTPTERQKYLNDEFLYELGIKHDHNGIDLHNNEDEYWDDTSWREGFTTYSTSDPENTSQFNYTIKTLKDGTEVTGLPINDGQIRLKDGESMTITHLPKTDIFYLAEEDQLDMDQFETPHAERLFIDSADMEQHEEEVHLHEDQSLSGGTSDWETRPYALMDTEKMVYTNTLQEKNLDVEKLWDDERSHEGIRFKLKATVDGEDYSTHTGHENINAQWTETRNNVTTTRTENILNKEFTLDSGNDWKILFEHLPKKTELIDDYQKEIIYTVEEVEESIPTGYTSTVGDEQDTNKVYLDLYKFWPDDNANHDGSTTEKKVEHIYTRVKTSDGKYLVATQDENGEYQFTGFSDTEEGGTRFLLTSKTQLPSLQTNDQKEMFDYAARVNNVPKASENGTGADYVYELEQDGDEDEKTKGLVMFTRPVRKVEILNEKIRKATLRVEKEMLGEVTGGDDKVFKVTIKNSATPALYLQADGQTFAETPYEFSLSKNAPLEFPDLPIDTYTVTEKTDGGDLDIGQYIWNSAESETEGSVLLVDEQVGTVILKNYYNENYTPEPSDTNEYENLSIDKDWIKADGSTTPGADDQIKVKIRVKSAEAYIPVKWSLYNGNAELDSTRSKTIYVARGSDVGFTLKRFEEEKVRPDTSFWMNANVSLWTEGGASFQAVDRIPNTSGASWGRWNTDNRVNTYSAKDIQSQVEFALQPWKSNGIWVDGNPTATGQWNLVVTPTGTKYDTLAAMRKALVEDETDESKLRIESLVYTMDSDGIALDVENTTCSIRPEDIAMNTSTWVADLTNLPTYIKVTEGGETHYRVYDYEVVEIEVNGKTVVDGHAGDYTVTTQEQDNNLTKITNKQATMDIVVRKVDDQPNSTNYLDGAVFELWYKAPGEDTWEIVSNTKVPELNSEGQFTVPGNAQGIRLTKLTDGTYKLVEKIPPAGFVVVNETPVVFEVLGGEIIGTDGTVDGAYTPAVEESTGVNASPAMFTIPNEPGAVLPSAGGPGTGLMLILGAVIMLTAGLLLYCRRRLYTSR